MEKWAMARNRQFTEEQIQGSVSIHIISGIKINKRVRYHFSPNWHTFKKFGSIK